MCDTNCIFKPVLMGKETKKLTRTPTLLDLLLYEENLRNKTPIQIDDILIKEESIEYIKKGSE